MRRFLASDTGTGGEQGTFRSHFLMAEVRNGIIFTTMFKFERGEKALSERRNIVVMADEAHRGQYGFDEKIVMSENENGEKEAHTVNW